MKKSWAQQELVDGKFYVFELYLDSSTHGKYYQAWQSANLGRNGAPYYAVINAQGNLVAAQGDIRKFGVQNGDSEDTRKTLFKEFLSHRAKAGVALKDPAKK